MNTALLLIDIQNDYFDGGTNSLVNSCSAAENARLLLENFRKHQLPVIHIQHLATRPTATFFLPGTYGAEIHTTVKPIENEKVIVKHFPNSFRQTELLDYLQSLKIEKLVIAGMMTHMCVDATTRAAKDFGFDCTVIADACATKNLEIDGKTINAENAHNAFLAALNYFYANVINTTQWLNT